MYNMQKLRSSHCKRPLYLTQTFSESGQQRFIHCACMKGKEVLNVDRMSFIDEWLNSLIFSDQMSGSAALGLLPL